MSSIVRKDVHVVMNLIDGSILKGTMMVDRSIRLSDMLNNHNRDFIVLTDYENTHHIINKRHVLKVVEIESVELEENQ
jgi:hypothetical protein